MTNERAATWQRHDTEAEFLRWCTERQNIYCTHGFEGKPQKIGRCRICVIEEAVNQIHALKHDIERALRNHNLDLAPVSETATHELFLGKKRGDSIAHFCHKCGAKNVIELKAPLSATATTKEPVMEKKCAKCRTTWTAAPNECPQCGSRVLMAMVDRFLSWKLPNDFSPDAGISFKPEYNVEYNAKLGRPPQRHEPIGTNLFTATQATEMIEHILGGAVDRSGA